MILSKPYAVASRVMGLLGQVICWVLLAFCASQLAIFAGLVAWGIWIDSIKPRLIPHEDIDREADTIIASYADPELEAFSRHERAWYDSDSAQQTYWRRVRKSVRKKLSSTMS